MLNLPNLVFTDPHTQLRAPATIDEWESQYNKCVERYGKHSRELACLFAAAGKMNYPLEYVPSAILNYASIVGDASADAIKARDVNEYLKSHPALMSLRYVDGKVDTFRPFQMAGVAYTVCMATGEEPAVSDFPIRDGSDVDAIVHATYLWCYSPTAYKDILAKFEGRESK